MKLFRSVFGFLILTLVGIPMVIATVWGVALVQTMSSPEVISDLPLKLISESPSLVDKFYNEIILKPDKVDDVNTKVWYGALAEAEMSPKEILTTVGIFDWLNSEVKPAFLNLGAILRKSRPQEEVAISLTDFKHDLTSKDSHDYILNVFDQLPDCNETQNQVWNGFITNQKNDGANENIQPPACRLDSKSMNLLLAKWNESVNSMENQQVIYQPDTRLAKALKQSGKVAYAFVLPLIILAIGSLVVNRSWYSLTRLSGFYLIASAVLGWLPSLILKPVLMSLGKNVDISTWYPVIEGVIYQLTSNLNLLFLIVGISGIILAVLSFWLKPVEYEELPLAETPISNDSGSYMSNRIAREANKARVIKTRANHVNPTASLQNNGKKKHVYRAFPQQES